MDSFAFIIHPIDPKKDVSRKFPLLGRLLTERQINFFSAFFPPVYISQIDGITSKVNSKEIRGWFIACPFTPLRMVELPEKRVYRKIIDTGHMAEKLGADILGLGAFTSVIGDAGITVARELEIPVTTGDSYTVAIAIESLLKASDLMSIPSGEASAAIIGATGAIGRICSEIIAGEVARLTLIGRDRHKLEALASSLRELPAKAQIITNTTMQSLPSTQLVLSVSSSLEHLIEPEHLRCGSVICDVARPRDVSRQVAAQRQDVLVIDGGMVDVPGPVDFHFDFGFPPGKAYACMAETMILTLEGRFEDYTIGKHITASQVREIQSLASKHGFQLSGFRSFEKPVTESQIERVRRAAAGRSQSKATFPL